VQLLDVVETLPFQIEPGQRWSAIGTKANSFATKFELAGNLLPFTPEIISSVDGLLLVGALSTPEMNTDERGEWLRQIVEPMREGTTVLAIDWQDDGPLNYGPDLSVRFKKGRLSRCLRETGFGQVDILEHHPIFYIVKGVKGPAKVLPYANEFVAVASVEELPRNAMKRVELFGNTLVVANTGREIVAFAQKCPHGNGPFDMGLLRGRNVVCPLHGYIWNVCSGNPVMPEDEDTLPRYATKIDETSGQVLVALTRL
jgi:nitrite reductase (NADH) small subunit